MQFGDFFTYFIIRHTAVRQMTKSCELVVLTLVVFGFGFAPGKQLKHNQHHAVNDYLFLSLKFLQVLLEFLI